MGAAGGDLGAHEGQERGEVVPVGRLQGLGAPCQDIGLLGGVEIVARADPALTQSFPILRGKRRRAGGAGEDVGHDCRQRSRSEICSAI